MSSHTSGPERKLEYVHRADGARVLVLSQRRLQPSVSRAWLFEFEDLIARVDAADVVAPTRPLEHPQRVWSGLSPRKRVTRRLRGRGPAISDRPYVESRYDLLVVVCEDVSDLLRLGVLERWLATARRAVCVLAELWTPHLAERGEEVELLAKFDGVFLSCGRAVKPLAAAIDRPVRYLLPGVDALSFCPSPPAPQRAVDVYNMGRRSEDAHRALHDLARARGWYYLYDTFTGNRAIDPEDHRRLLAATVQRSRYFVAFPAKSNERQLIGAQEEIGPRMMEGAAGGAVLIGRAPRNETFRRAFPYDDALVSVGDDAAGLREAVEALEADPQRVARIRAAHVGHTLQHHDWVYRWRTILAAHDLAPRKAAAERVMRLNARRQQRREVPSTRRTGATEA